MLITALKIIAVLVAGYLLGSISAAIIVSKYIFKGDVREAGSHNAGTTNMARVYGMGAGILTLIGDILKTVLAMLFGRLLLGEMGFSLGAIACIVGHCFPIFFGFKGGKAVAVSSAVVIMLGWQHTAVLLALFLIIAISTRYVSLASLITSLAIIPVVILFGGYGVWVYILTAVIVIFVWYMHRGNIKRLLTGTESKFVPGKRKK